MIEKTYTLRELLNAIAHVETGHAADSNYAKTCVGDNGDALGPYQLHLEYVEDATGCRIMPNGTNSITPSRANQIRTSPALSVRCFLAYMHRYHPEILLNAVLSEAACEILARTHNGGPDGAEHEATLLYWERVKGRL